MTDEQMDARLRRAGDAWRAAQVATHADETTADPVDLALHAPRRRRPHTALLLSAAALVAALVAGIALVVVNLGGNDKHRSADVVDLEGVVWRLVSYGSTPPRVNSTATVVFNKDGTFVADDGCLLFGGSYELDHGTLYAVPHDLRNLSCTDTAGEVAFGDRGLQLLTGGSTYRVEGGDLSIGDGGQTMHLRAAPELPRPTLDVPTVEGATWMLTDVTDGSGHRLPVQGHPTFVIKNHELRASDGCNTLSGEADVIGNTLSTGKGGGLQQTAIGCIGAAADVAAVADSVLSHDARVSVAGATMTIKGAGGTLTYRWQPADASATDPALLEGRSWIVTSVAGAPASGRLDFGADGRLTARYSCMTYTARADIGPGTLSLRDVSGRPANCTLDGTASTIDSFLHQRPALWAVRDGQLLIFGGGPQAFSIVLTTLGGIRVVTPPPTIEGKTWTLSEISSEGPGIGSGSGSSDSGVVLTVRTATFTLETRCHNYSGAVVRKGDTVTFSAVRDLGGRNCHDEFTDAALKLVRAGTATWSITRGQLVLEQGSTTLTFDG